MDNQKFGAFLSSLRKEKGWTQLELAEKLHVTDKAVSKWERGMGFPDIKTIEPLAAALEVSVLELMRSERIENVDTPAGHAEEAITNIIDAAVDQRKMERRNAIITAVSVMTVILLIFLVDLMNWEGFILACLPVVSFTVGVALLFICIHRRKQKLSYTAALVLGIIAILFPMLLCLLLYFAFVFGGPIPT